MTTQTPIKRGTARRLGLIQPVPFTWEAFHESVAAFGERLCRLATGVESGHVAVHWMNPLPRSDARFVRLMEEQQP